MVLYYYNIIILYYYTILIIYNYKLMILLYHLLATMGQLKKTRARARAHLKNTRFFWYFQSHLNLIQVLVPGPGPRP